MQKQNNIICKHLNDCLLTSFKTTSQTIKQYANKNLYENHNKLMNQILLVSEKDILNVIKSILTHLISIVQVKNCRDVVISMLTKFIQFMKFYQKTLTKNKLTNMKQRDEINQDNSRILTEILTQLVDIILLTQNRTKMTQTQTLLRIIQTTFSLIDYQFVQYMQYSLLTKIFSISFECCSGGPVLQNISVSCLFSLTQTVFSNPKKLIEAHLILQNFLEYLFRSKKFSWIKDAELNGIVWDLVVAGINNSKHQDLQKFIKKQSNYHLINLMYKVAAEKAFNPKFHSKTVPQNHSQKKQKYSQNSINFKHDQVSDFIRCYKAFIVLSIQYSLQPLQSGTKQETVPFRDNLKLFNIIYDQERNYKMYIMLEGVFMLIDKHPKFAIDEENGHILLEIISKICEELCLCNQKIDCSFTNEKTFLDKFYYGDLNNINEGDFVKIIKNSIIHLRKKFENLKNLQEQSSPRSDLHNESMTSERSQVQQPKVNNPTTSLKKRWQKFIKCIIKIIRYLSSISLLSQTDQQPVRKIILQLQHWFLICPLTKIKNMILQQLLITTSTLKSKPQAIKISQCIQIGSNLIYGYYDMLDSVGLTIIMKMMASIKAEREDGKEYEQLEEVFNMSEKLYLQQKIVKNLKHFQMTVQAFVQCANSLLADLQQPSSSSNSKRTSLGKNPSERYFKMIDYLLQKLNIVLLQNKQYLFQEWNFLTGFWMSFCSNKNPEIQIKTISYVGEIVHKLFESFVDRQEQIMSIYLQLGAKCSLKNDFKVQLQIIAQIKDYIPLLENQQALMETLKIIKILQTQIKGNQEDHKFNITHLSEVKKFIIQLSELQQSFIKQGIFRIKKLNYLANVLKGIEVLGSQKNQEYKIFTLLWNFADHLRNMAINYDNQHMRQNQKKKQKQKQKQEYEQLWREVFYKLAYISGSSFNSETKQSSIHTFTQIIAENSGVISDHLLNQLYEKVFIEKLFTNLIILKNIVTDSHENHQHQISSKVDMIKASSKNYLKLTKKFILQNIFKEQKQKYITLGIQKILFILSQSNQRNQVIPVEILYQYVVFIQKLLLNEDIPIQYINKNIIMKILEMLGEIGKRANQTTILWKKKYLPHYEEVKSVFDKINVKNNDDHIDSVKEKNLQDKKEGQIQVEQGQICQIQTKIQEKPKTQQY